MASKRAKYQLSLIGFGFLLFFCVLAIVVTIARDINAKSANAGAEVAMRLINGEEVSGEDYRALILAYHNVGQQRTLKKVLREKGVSEDAIEQFGTGERVTVYANK